MSHGWRTIVRPFVLVLDGGGCIPFMRTGTLYSRYPWQHQPLCLRRRLRGGHVDAYGRAGAAPDLAAGGADGRPDGAADNGAANGRANSAADVVANPAPDARADACADVAAVGADGRAERARAERAFVRERRRMVHAKLAEAQVHLGRAESSGQCTRSPEQQHRTKSGLARFATA